jgi:hypothetical protein
LLFNKPKKPNKVVTELETMLQNTLERDTFLFDYQTSDYPDPDKSMKIEAFYKKHFEQSITDSFVENCKTYIFKRVRKMDSDKAKLFLGICYNVYFATVEVIKKKYEKGELTEVPEVTPHSRYRTDLKFNRFNYGDLLRLIKPWIESKKMYGVKNVKAGFELAFKYSSD